MAHEHKHKHKHHHIWRGLGEFVSEGVMLAIPLNFPGQTVAPPAGETAMNVLAIDPGDTVYCGTAGARAHVVAVMVRRDTGVGFDMGVIPGATRIDALAVGDEDVYVIASGPAGCGLWTMPRVVRGFLIQEWFLRRPPAEKICDLLSEGCVADAVAIEKGVLHGIIEPSGELFSLNLTSPKINTIACVDEEGEFSRRLGLDAAGRLWGTSGWGQIWSCDPSVGEIERHGEVPAAAGRGQHTQASAWATDPLTGVLYGGTTPDGFLFSIDPVTAAATPLGKPTRQDEITCLTVGNDGRVFGMAGEEDDIAHLFCYEPQRPALRDLGMAVSALAGRQYGHHFRCMAVGQYGEIYLGQHERINHLWVYFPPVPKRPAEPT